MVSYIRKEHRNRGGANAKGKSGWASIIRDRCECGEEKFPTDYVCVKCYAKHSKPEPRPKRTNRSRWDVEYVPDDTIPSGVFFNSEEIKFMLDDGYFPPGTILRARKFRYMVFGRPLEPQWLSKMS